ncbi:apical junction molecule-like isoform X4 [Argopecten irradians]|uniref:apical junction molecule-like isoform X4 n=1 Tax=Argopecten irradians TaxID=31199 RepID=UPI003715A1F7
MFSPLSRGYGTWSGELYDPYKDDIDTESLPCIDPGENTHRHGITVGLGSRAPTTMSMRSTKEQPLTCTLTPRSDGKLNIPKTFTTRKGALILFSSQEDVDNTGSVSRSSSRQKSALSKKFNAIETCSALGTLDRLSLSVLQYGDEEDYDRENTSIADEKNKMVLNFIHSLDDRDVDSRVRPGSELSSYLRDLKYRSSCHGATYLPRSRETMELRALLKGLQDNRWPMSYSSTEGAPSLEKSSTYADQFTRPSSRGSTRPGSPASGTTTPRSILSARKLTASIKSLNTYRQQSIAGDSEDGDDQSTSTHPTISAKVTRRSPPHDDSVRTGSPQRSRTQRLGQTSITGSIEEEPSDYKQGQWRGSSVGTYHTGSDVQDVSIPSNLDRDSYLPEEQDEGHSLIEQGPIPEEGPDMDGSEVNSHLALDKNNVNSDQPPLVKIPTGTEATENVTKSPKESKPSTPIRASSGGKGSPRSVTTPTKAGSRQSSAKRVPSGRKSPRREATPVKLPSRQSSAKINAEKQAPSQELEVKDTETLVAMEAKAAVDLEDVASIASSVLVEQDIVLPPQDEPGEASNGETASVPVNGIAQPLQPQYTGSVTSGEGLMVKDDVPPAPVASPRSSRPVSKTSTSRPASHKTDLPAPAAKEPKVESPKVTTPQQKVEENVTKVEEKKIEPKEEEKEQKTPDTAGLTVGTKEEAKPKPPEGGRKGQQRRGHLPRGKKAKKDVTKAIDISSVKPDEEEKPKEHAITVYKTVKIAPQKEEVIIPDFISEEATRREEDSKEALEKQMVEMSQIVDYTMSGTVLEDGEAGLTDKELELAQKQILEKMADAKEMMERVEKPQTLREEKPVKKPAGKKGGKKNVEKKEVDKEKEKLKEMRRLEKEQRLEEARALQEKIDKQRELRKAKEKEARDKGKLNTDNVELELEMERLEREAEEMQQAEDEVRYALAEARKKQREEREGRRKADLERKKQLAIERREKERKIMEDAKNKELEMLEKIEDANVRKRQREEEEKKQEEEERLAQERLEEEMREAERLAEEEEERLRELERQAEEEAMQRLIEEREEATRKKRQIEEQKRLIEEEEERKRQVIIEEERRLEAERLKRAEEEDRKLQEEKRRLAELHRIETEAREQMQKELAHRREIALARRERNLEARSNMTRLKHGQGITQPWVWSYFIQWPLETYNIPIGGEPDDKKKKRPKPKGKR